MSINPWIDVTLTLSTDMVVWRGDPPFYIRKKMSSDGSPVRAILRKLQ